MTEFAMILLAIINVPFNLNPFGIFQIQLGFLVGTVNVTGYAGQLAHQYSYIEQAVLKAGTFIESGSLPAGSSGGPLWVSDGSQFYSVGIHITGGQQVSSPGGAVAFSSADMAEILSFEGLPGVANVADGYISGATVFSDANSNRQLDPGEASTTTDSTGSFSLTGGSGPLIAFGGTDISTGLPFKGELSVPIGSSIVSPLTSLIGTSGQAAVLAALGLPSSIDLTNFDAIAEIKSGDPNGIPVTVSEVFSFIGHQIELGESIYTENAGTIATWIDAIAASHSLHSAGLVGQVATDIAATNSSSPRKGFQTGQNLLGDVAAIQSASEGPAADAVQQVLATAGATLVEAIDVGGSKFTASNGVTYEADPGPTSGISWNYANAVDIAGTSDDPLFNTERFAPNGGSFTYDVPVANGTYLVELDFAEIYFSAPGKRVFDVVLEGQSTKALQNIDLVSLVGADKPYVVDEVVKVTDGLLSIQVGPGGSVPGNVENAKLSAFAIYSLPPTSGQALSIEAAAAEQNEGNSGSTSFTFTVTRSGDSSGASSAIYAVAGSGINPADAADFTGDILPSGIVSFEPGETSKTIAVGVAGDTAVETNETFIVTLSAPSAGTTVATAEATGTILNDDTGATLVKAIDVGGGQFTASNGVTYDADPGPTSGFGWMYSNAVDIPGTSDVPLFDTERFAPNGGSFTYDVPVANGTYLVELDFAEIYFSAPGKRVFDVVLEGQNTKALQHIDLVSLVGADKPYIVDEVVTVTDGLLSIQVGPGGSVPGNVENAKLSTFAIYGLNMPSIDAGDLAGASNGSVTSAEDAGQTEVAPSIINIVTAGEPNQILLTGRAEPSSAVSIFDNNQFVGTAQSSSGGFWAFAPTATANTIHSYSENAFNGLGASAKSTGVALYAPATGQVLTGGTGDDILIGRPNDTLIGAGGRDTFVFNPNFGNQTVSDFVPGADVLQFDHSLFPDATAALQHAQQSGADTVISHDTADAVTLKNVLLSSLHTADFHII